MVGERELDAQNVRHTLKEHNTPVAVVGCRRWREREKERERERQSYSTKIAPQHSLYTHTHTHSAKRRVQSCYLASNTTTGTELRSRLCDGHILTVLDSDIITITIIHM